MSDPRTRSLLVDAGLAAGRLTVEYRRSSRASLLDLRDPSSPVIILHPDESPEVLMAECVEQCARLVAWSQERGGADVEVYAQAVNDDGPVTDVSARARRRGLTVIQGGAVG